MLEAVPGTPSVFCCCPVTMNITLNAGFCVCCCCCPLFLLRSQRWCRLHCWFLCRYQTVVAPFSLPVVFSLPFVFWSPVFVSVLIGSCESVVVWFGSPKLKKVPTMQVLKKPERSCGIVIEDSGCPDPDCEASFVTRPSSSTKFNTFLVPGAQQVDIPPKRSRNGCETALVEKKPEVTLGSMMQDQKYGEKRTFAAGAGEHFRPFHLRRGPERQLSLQHPLRGSRPGMQVHELPSNWAYSLLDDTP